MFKITKLTNLSLINRGLEFKRVKNKTLPVFCFFLVILLRFIISVVVLEMASSGPVTEDMRRQKALEDYRKKLIEHKELDSKLKKSMHNKD